MSSFGETRGKNFWMLKLKKKFVGVKEIIRSMLPLMGYIKKIAANAVYEKSCR